MWSTGLSRHPTHENHNDHDRSTAPAHDRRRHEHLASRVPVLNRYAGKKDAILFCIHALQATPEIEVEDVPQQAATHGVRVTAAYLNGASTLLDPDGNSVAQSPRLAA